MITFSDVQNSSIKDVTGCTSTSSKFAQIINEVCERLLQRGDWTGTLLPIRVCMSAGCVTWPRYVGQVRRMNSCHQAIEMRNQWYEFLKYKGENRHNDWQSWCGRERSMKMQYRAPTYNDIYGPYCTLRVIPMVAQDVGASVTFFGTDNNNQPLMTQTNGVWTQGITVKAAFPYGESVNQYYVSHIDRVVKTTTQGNLMVYAYDTVQKTMFDLAVYEPSETNPSYLRYSLDGEHARPSCNARCAETIIALVKLQFVPVSSPTDLVLIDNIGALKFGVKAWKREEADDFGGAGTLWSAAIEQLNRQIENENPDDTFSSMNNVFAGREFRNQMF